MLFYKLLIATHNTGRVTHSNRIGRDTAGYNRTRTNYAIVPNAYTG